MRVEHEYADLLGRSHTLCGDALITFWLDELPYLCRDRYLESTLRPVEIIRVQQGTFEYVFDNYGAFEHRGEVPYTVWEEDRLVVVSGRSCPPAGRPRDDYRLSGWVAPTTKAFGTVWDKGHYIGHSLGGVVDGFELNVFVQRRDLNRGWSAEGKRYRAMEKYCATHAGTFCFARAIYQDGTSRPAFLDFGLITTEGEMQVERFDNRSMV